MNFKVIISVISLFVGVLSFSACNDDQVTTPEEPVVEELVLSMPSVSLTVDETKTVSITSGNGGYTAEVTEGEDYASVEISGDVISVTGIAEGTATITVTDQEDKTAALSVTVEEKEAPPVEAVELLLEVPSLKMQKGDTESVAITEGNGGYTATVTEGDGVVSVSVSEEDDVFSVEITALTIGKAKITVTDDEEKTATITVAVSPAVSDMFGQNLVRAMGMIDAALPNYFLGESDDDKQMKRYYNPYADARYAEVGSVWMYTGVIESVNAVLNALKAGKDAGYEDFYNAYYNTYYDWLVKLYNNITYYRLTFTFTSYTKNQKVWMAYAVNRGAKDRVSSDPYGDNVYDDQMWLIKEMLESYHATGENKYLEEAEKLTEYVLDGWDCTLNGSGVEYGGITWGPSYTSMHACSNGPMVSPLVWLHEIYKNSDETTLHYYVGTDNSRNTKTVKKADYYLEFAEKIYAFHKTQFMRSSSPFVYGDMRGGSGGIGYTTVGGVQYRKHNNLGGLDGTAYAYNSGTMLSGAADLYRVTGKTQYITDATALGTASFNYFSTADSRIPGGYAIGNKNTGVSQFCRWFDCVLMRGFMDMSPYDGGTSQYLGAYQNTLDTSYKAFAHNGLLPKKLLEGWNTADKYNVSNNKVEALETFAYASEYAVLARYELEKDN